MHYRMRQKLFAIGDDYWVEDENGHKAFKVNGKAMRVRKTFVLETPDGDEVVKIKEKMLRVRGTMDIERKDEALATVTKAMISPLRHRFKIDLERGGELRAKGNFLDHEYTIERDGHRVAEVSKRWFRARDTYGIDVEPGEDDALILASVVCIDELAHD